MGWFTRLSSLMSARVSSLLLLARDLCSLSHGPLHRAAHDMAVSLLYIKPVRRDVQDRSYGFCFLFCNLIFEVSAHQFLFLLFVTSKPLGLAHTQREEMTQSHEYQEVEIIGGHLRTCLAQGRLDLTNVCVFMFSVRGMTSASIKPYPYG